MEELSVILVFVAGMLSASALIAFGIAAHWLSEAYRGQRPNGEHPLEPAPALFVGLRHGPHSEAFAQD